MLATAHSGSAMETRDHSKNGVSLKKQKCKGNLIMLGITLITFLFAYNAYGVCPWSGGGLSPTNSWNISDNSTGGNVYAYVDGNILKIYGTGNMADFWSSLGGDAPWNIPECYSNPNSITHIEIQDGVTNIGDCAFKDLQNFKTINIPNTVKTIGIRAFYNCSNPGFKSIIIPSSVIKIEGEAFRNCSNLDTITIKNDSKNLHFSKYCINGTTITKDCNSYNAIGNWFTGCLCKVLYLGRNYTATSSDKPFADISSMNTLTIGGTVTSIPASAFSSCNGLTKVTFQDGTANLSFNNSTNQFPGSSIETLFIDRNIVDAYSYYNPYSPFSQNTSLKTVSFGNSVKSVIKYAFYACGGLTDVTISNSVTSIEEYAFYNCNSLTFVALPDEILSIKNNSFQKSGLASIIIPSNVISLESNAFADCPSLKNVTFQDGSSNLPFKNSTNQFLNSPIETLHLGRNIVEAYSYYSPYTPFSHNTSLKTVTYGNDVKNIIKCAFYGCINLKNISISNSITSIEEYAFYECSSLTSVAIPDIFSIEKSVFQKSGLKSIYIPNSIISIKNNAFSDCPNLKNVTFQDGPSNLSFNNYTNQFSGSSIEILHLGRDIVEANSYYRPYSPFSDNTNLKTVTIGNDVTKIVKCAFYDCKGLSSVTIRNNVTSIGEGAFYNCVNLNSPVNIPEGVTTIEAETFYNCNKLSSINIPRYVLSIKNGAFYNCSGLTDIISQNPNPPVCGNGYSTKAFDGVNKTTCKLNVPQGAEEAYGKAYEWKDFFNILSTPTNISGKVFRTNQTTLSSGVVSLYKVETLSQYYLVKTVNIGTSGKYEFENVIQGAYIIKVTPPVAENALPTYYGNTEMWYEATLIVVANTFVPNIDITILPEQKVPVGGSGIKGNVITGGGSKSNSPVKDAVVYLISFENNIPTTVTTYTSNAAGFFEFPNLSAGKYMAIVDIPGLKMLNTILLELEDAEPISIIFTVANNGIKTTLGTVAINNIAMPEIKIFPNPAHNELTIESGDLKIEKIEIYDLTGRKTFNSQFSILNSQLKINVSTLHQGMYLLHIYTDKGTIARKFVKE